MEFDKATEIAEEARSIAEFDRTPEQAALVILLDKYCEAKHDLDEALDAVEDVMGYDKGIREEEWVEWCNEHLPLMKRHGRQQYTHSWS